MSTLRVSNIEAKADVSSPTVDEKIKFTNSSGDVLFHLDGKTSGITTVGINTTGNTFTVNNTTGDVSFSGSVTSSGVSTYSNGLNVTSGNVGIGTDNPTSKLEVYNSSSTPVVKISGPTSGSSALEFYASTTKNGALLVNSSSFLIAADNSNPITFNAGGSERLRISSTGRVSINDGTRPADDANAGAQLRVTGVPVTRAQYYSPAGDYFGSFGYTNDTHTKAWISVDSDYNKGSAISSGIFLSAFHSDANGSSCGHTIKNLKSDAGGLVLSSVNAATSTGNPAVETERVRITSTGNVGIGTANPGYTLDVQGGQNVTTQISLWGKTIGQPQTLVEPGRIYATSAGLGPGNLLLQPTGGNLGIGTDSPSQILHLHAPANDLAVIRLSGTAALQIPYNIRQGIVGVSNAGFSIYDVTAATTRFAIDSAGNIGIGAANPAAKLDVRSGGIVVGKSSSAVASMTGIGVGGAAPVIYDTGMAINQYGAGGAMLLLASVNSSNGTATASAVYLIRFYYDGNNTPSLHYIGGSSNFVTVDKSASNTLILRSSLGGNLNYSWFANKGSSLI